MRGKKGCSTKGPIKAGFPPEWRQAERCVFELRGEEGCQATLLNGWEPSVTEVKVHGGIYSCEKLPQ